jgi:hypothetical protein
MKVKSTIGNYLKSSSAINISPSQFSASNAQINTTFPSSSFIGYSNSISPQKTSYIILGTKIDVSGYNDMNLAMLVTNININGIEFYIELKDQLDECEANIGKEIFVFLENELVSYYRNKNINEIIK